AFAVKQAVVSRGEQLALRSRIMRKRCQAKRRAKMDVQPFFLQEGRLGNGLPHALDLLERALARIVGENNYVFVATVTNQSVLLVQHPVNALRDFLERFGTQKMPIPVHAQLEIIQVEKYKRHFIVPRCW